MAQGLPKDHELSLPGILPSVRVLKERHSGVFLQVHLLTPH